MMNMMMRSSLSGISKEEKRLLAAFRCKPIINDPKEFQTIMNSSLRALFGECCHVHSVTVKKIKNDTVFIQCPYSCLPSIRSALTWPTSPSHLRDTMYRFDMLENDI